MSERVEVIVDAERMYALAKSADGRLFLEVSTGGFALEDVVGPLAPEDVERYLAEGKAYLDVLALKIAKRPSEYRSRGT